VNKTSVALRFDRDFYRRYYQEARTRVVTRAEMSRRADLIAAFARHSGTQVRTILDLGCGLGLMRRALLKSFPAARYTGVEASAYLCRKYGWTESSVATYKSARPCDLVICYDVLQYVEGRQAAAAVRNFGSLCRGILHFGVLTKEDWYEHCDQRLTDADVHLRPAAWYRRRLSESFVDAGLGMFVHRDSAIHLWELERVPSRHRGK
jgi:predicted TPR repeat methyltransferase